MFLCPTSMSGDGLDNVGIMYNESSGKSPSRLFLSLVPVCRQEWVQHTASVRCPLTAAPPGPEQGVPGAVQPQPHQVPPLQGRRLTCTRHHTRGHGTAVCSSLSTWSLVICGANSVLGPLLQTVEEKLHNIYKEGRL